jgi:hypothetical protein
VSDRSPRRLVALFAPLVILVFVGWWDGHVLREAAQSVASTFDPLSEAWAPTSGYLVAAAAVLAVGYLAFWAGSLVVGLVYVLVGGFLTLLYPIGLLALLETNGAPPRLALPEPILTAVSDIWAWAFAGRGSYVLIIGAAMFLSGLGAIVLDLRSRRSVPS